MTTEVELTPEQYHELEKLAKQSRKTVSELIAEVVEQVIRSNGKRGKGWPPGFFESTFGCMSDTPIVRSSQGEFEVREKME